MFDWFAKLNCLTVGGKCFSSLYSLLPFLVFSILAYLILSFLARKLPRYKKKLFNSLSKSIAFILIAYGLLNVLVPWGIKPKLLYQMQIALLTFAPFLIGSSIFRFALVKLSLKLTSGKKSMIHLLARVADIFIITMGFITALNELGYDLTVLIGSLGISGLALGLAVKETVTNTVCGFLIIFYEPFKVGSHVTIAGKEGIVEKIELKYVTLRQNKKVTHILPNSKVFSEIISLIEEETSER